MSVEKKTEILRQRAEKILLTLPESDTDISRENIRHLIHELQVHQIELEIQNEELRNNQRIVDENRRRYFSLFDNAPVGYVILDKSGIIRQFNKTFAEMIAQESLMPSKKAFADLLLPEDAQVFRSRFNALLKNPKDKQIEARIVSGHFKECHVLIKTDLHDGTPGSTRVEDQELLLTVMDITERKQVEVALKESELFLRTLLDDIPIPVFYKDRRGVYRGVNKTFETFFGKTQEEIEGKTVYDINPPDLAVVYHEKDKALIDHGGSQHYESRVKNAAGEYRDVIFNKAVYQDKNGMTQGLIGAILDITERKASEEDNKRLIRQLTEALGQVKQLCGLLPICSHCKKIRDDKGYWQEVEAYIHTHSEARFSHGICRECAKKYYPDFDLYEDNP